MTQLENEMKVGGWVRCPNVDTRWYPAFNGQIRPALPMEIRVTDAIWLVTSRYGRTIGQEIIPLMRFDSVASLNDYLSRNGVESPKSGANVWD